VNSAAATLCGLFCEHAHLGIPGVGNTIGSRFHVEVCMDATTRARDQQRERENGKRKEKETQSSGVDIPVHEVEAVEEHHESDGCASSSRQ